MTPARASYRLQVHAGFDFAAAQKVVPYLARLGITELYLSPIWQAEPGSMHGYNVTDHARVNSELGGERAYSKLAAAARAAGLGVIVDFVPNHMGVGGGHNPYWEDLLQNGRASPYREFFDVDWQPLRRSLDGKVLLPTLGDQYGVVLANGELVLEQDGGQFFVRYYERRFPVSPRTVAPLLEEAARASGLDPDDADRMELDSVATQARNLPRSDDEPDLDARLVRARESQVMQRRLEALLARSRAVKDALTATVGAWNAAENRDRMDTLLMDQNYRLAFWRVASEEINYRRFFDINDLAALRMEDPRVFEWAHALLLRLIASGEVTGVRLDHTDGLYDPAGYFEALQARAGEVLQKPYERGGELPLYLVAEKILEPGEALPRRWAVHGTTGYDFLAQLGGVFVDTRNDAEMTGMYRRFTGETASYGEMLHTGKLLIERASLASEVNLLAERLQRLADADRRSRDFTLSALRAAIRAVIASFPVYRSYVREDGAREERDNAHINKAVRDARRLNRDLDVTVFDFLRDVLTLRVPEGADRAAWAQFALKFQQLTGPVTAKGAEDTAFYRYNRLLALNEVGGDPALFGTPLEVFHRETANRARDWPEAMLSTATHDTKRGEDTRARIAVLSEMPQTWAAYLSTWSVLARRLSRDLEGVLAPSLNDTYAVFQNLLGTWPLDGDFTDYQQRLTDYMIKVAREAKQQTSWLQPDEAYESALTDFIASLLADPEFRSGMEELHARISPHGAQNSLSATLARLTAPGLPDTYQGAELWNQTLVDPDNRRPVDYRRRTRALTDFEKRHADDPRQVATDLLARFTDGRVKLFVTWAALQARRAHPELFGEGTYVPLDADDHLLAFAREREGERAVVLAPRLSFTLTGERTPWALGDVWGDARVTLPTGRYVNVLTGEAHDVTGEGAAVADLLRHFPLALLISDSAR